jgi:hypothetical protein
MSKAIRLVLIILHIIIEQKLKSVIINFKTEEFFVLPFYTRLYSNFY